MSRNFYVRTLVKFTFANEIEAVHERSLVSVKVEPRSTSPSLRGRRLAKERTTAREGDTQGVSPFFLVPTTSKRLLRRLNFSFNFNTFYIASI